MEPPSESESEPEPEYSFSESESSRYSFSSTDDEDENNSSNVNVMTENTLSSGKRCEDTSDQFAPEKHELDPDSSKPSACPEAGCKHRTKRESDLKNHMEFVHKKTMTGEPLSKQRVNLRQRSELVNYFPASQPSSQRSPVRKGIRVKNKTKKRVRSRQSPEKISCRFPGCSKQLCSRKSLAEHFIRAHTNERPFPCPESDCEYRAKTERDMRKHRLSLHFDRMPEIVVYTCPYPGCNSQSGIKSQISRHFRDAHRTDRLTQCPSSGCGYSAKTNAALNQHMLNFHGNDRPFPCPSSSCRYSSKTRGDLNRHVASGRHISFMFSCDEPGCGFKSVVQKLMDNHQEQAHAKKASQSSRRQVAANME